MSGPYGLFSRGATAEALLWLTHAVRANRYGSLLQAGQFAVERIARSAREISRPLASSRTCLVVCLTHITTEPVPVIAKAAPRSREHGQSRP